MGRQGLHAGALVGQGNADAGLAAALLLANQSDAAARPQTLLLLRPVPRRTPTAPSSLLTLLVGCLHCCLCRLLITNLSESTRPATTATASPQHHRKTTSSVKQRQQQPWTSSGKHQNNPADSARSSSTAKAATALDQQQCQTGWFCKCVCTPRNAATMSPAAAAATLSLVFVNSAAIPSNHSADVLLLMQLLDQLVPQKLSFPPP